MPSLHDSVIVATSGAQDGDGQWAELGVPAQDVAQWKAQGFGPFEAALAQGDGFSPSIVTHYRRQLLRIARAWERQCLDSAEGLHWHRAGFAVPDAVRWRAQGVDVATARIHRDGYDQMPGRSGRRGRVRRTYG